MFAMRLVCPQERMRLYQPQPLEARVPVLADDDVVVHRDAQWLRHRGNLKRHRDIRLRGRRVSGGVVVHQTTALTNVLTL